MITPNEIDDDLEEEVIDECKKYGDVLVKKLNDKNII